ncbi:hypothetical protein [Thermocrinis sp.]
MNIDELLRDINKGHSYEVITAWHGVPVRIKLKVKWVSTQDRLVSFDFSECKFRRAFTKEKVYIKLGEIYIECEIFSNIRDELVLLVNSVSPPPPVVLREFVRVEPSKNKPVLVSFCVEDECISSVEAVDISEKGVGVMLTKGEMEKLFSILSTDDGRGYQRSISLVIEIPGEGPIEAVGELKNLISKDEGVYFRLGFKLNLGMSDLRKLRNYIINRQREILEKLRSL